MGMNKSKGNMYDWVTHTWSPITGCMYQCDYCYVKAYRDHPVVAELREDFPKLGEGKTIFVGHLCDMFSDGVDYEMIDRVLHHCAVYPNNRYVFQTKNPSRILRLQDMIPLGSVIGTTIETNRDHLAATVSDAPDPSSRARAIKAIRDSGFATFITIEPILAFDPHPFAEIVSTAKPHFVNIGADSKGHGLDEPTWADVATLIELLKLRGIDVRQKRNLNRLKDRF